MSLDQLESAIVALPLEQRWELAAWFDEHLEEMLGDPEPSPAQRAEILRRREAFLADPSIAEPWEGTADRIHQHLHARRAQKAASSGR